MSASRTQYSSPFDPSSIPGCQLWIDASDPSTVTTSGGVVTAVQDKSSNKYNLSNGNGFTYNVTKFNTSYPSFYRASSLANARVGSNTSISTTQPYTMAFVVQADIAVGTARTFLRSTLSTTDTFINFESLSSSSTNRFGLWAGSSTLRATANVPISVTIVTVNAASTTGIQNSTTTLSGNPGPFGLVGVNIGGDTAGSFVGHICEFLIWTNTVFSTLQRQQVEGYLALKWGISSLLPATHPFRSIPPTLRQFTPLDVPNCIVWLDAADRATILQSVTQWRDKSGNNNHVNAVGTFSNATIAYNQLNGSNVVDFAGSNLYRSAGSGVYPSDCYVVVALKSLAARADVIGIGNTGNDNFNSLTFGEHTAVRWHNGSSGFSRTPLTVAPANETSTGFLLMNWSLANNNFVLRRNGTQLSSTASYTYTLGSPSAFQLGYRLTNLNTPDIPLNAFVAEVILYNSQLGTSDREQVEGYLAWKWGLQGNLPAGHPYRSTRLFGFLPTSLTGCSAWLDGADISTFTLSSNVSTWRDKSGNGYDGTGSGLVLPTYSSNIFNGGYPGITISNFTQSNNTNDNRFQFTIPANTFPSGFSAISVYRPTNSTNGNSPYSRPIGGAIPRPIDTFTSSTLNRRLIGNGTQYWEITITAGTGYSYFVQSNTIYSFSANSNTFFSWNEFVNGVASPVAGSLFSNGTVTYSDATSTTLRLQLMGIHCEHILYNGTLSIRNRQLLEGYLARKWGLQSNMPAIHPYRFSPLTGFTPTSLTGCALWLDAADASTFTLSGTTVTQWRDRSGNARNCSTGFGTGPSYSNLAVNFSGTNGLVNPLSASVTTESAFIVASIGNTTGTLTFLGVQTGAGIGGRLFFIDKGIMITQRLDINNVLSDGVVIGANQRNLFEYVNTGTTLTHYLNGNMYSFGPASTYSNGLASAIGTRTGNIWRFIGSMHEIIVYSNALSSNDRQQVEGYLAQKWGISDALGHSFGSLGVPPIVPSFVPTAISGSILWWDAADRTVFTGGATWTDKSGSNNTGINGTPGASTMPTLTTWDNGNSAARFVAGSKHSVKTTNTIPNLNVTYFMVARMQAPVASGSAYLMINNIDGQRQINTSSTSFPMALSAHANSTAGSNIQFASVGQSEPFLYGATIVSGASGFLTYTNGTANAVRGVTTSSASRHYFGSADGDSGYVTFDVGEIIIYNTVLSTSNRQLVEGYLSWKWGLQTRLPANHPYRTIKI